MLSRQDDEVPDAAPTLDENATLDDYKRYAALNNPGLKAAFHRWQAASERAPQVGALPDPQLTYGYYIGEVETRVGPMQHMFGVSQTFPWFGTLDERQNAESRAAMAEYRRFEARRLDLYFDVEAAYNDLYLLRRTIEITSENVELLQQFERVARARYRVGSASHPVIIRIQVELGKLEDRHRQLEDMREPLAARLNAALNRAPNEPLAWPSLVERRITDATVGDLLAILKESNPTLQSLRERIESERHRTEIARKDGRPDFTLGLAYTVIDDRSDASVSENGDDAVLASISFNVPLWREKYDAGVREATSRRLSLASEQQQTVNELASDLQQALFDHHDARRRVTLYEATLIPKATESLQASLTAFEQGEADFLDLIDTERTLLEFQIALVRATVDRATSFAHLQRLTGASIPSSAGDHQSKEAGE
jgi:outer membrane protein TolC